MAEKDENQEVMSLPGEEKSTVAVYNAEIKRELADPAVMRALIDTTFKKMTEKQVRQAMLEGMIRGFTIKDFFQKNVYAIAYGDSYSLVTSVDLARKRGQRGGISGTSKPDYTYTTDEAGKKVIESCTVTVYKSSGHPDGYSAQAFFSEYYKAGKTYNGKYTPSMWDQKPHTMIAKVAEMQALRKACPDDLAQIYVEEEFHSAPEPMRHIDVDDIRDGAPTIGSMTKHAKGKKAKAQEGETELDIAGNH